MVAAVAEGDQGQVRKDVRGLLHEVIDAASYQAAEEVMQRLRGYPGAAQLAQKVYFGILLKIEMKGYIHVL